MKLLRPCLQASERSTASLRSSSRVNVVCRRNLQSSAPKPATPLSHPVAPGPPPKPPVPAPTPDEERVARKKKNAELLERGRSIRGNPKPGSALQKRFWKDVDVKETPDGYQVYLDARPVRTPAKHILTIPLSKPHLATSIALEWDLLTSAQQALKTHYIPMTSITSRALDIAHADLTEDPQIRDHILKMAMRYLSTDTLLCWAPEKNMHDADEVARQRFIKGTATGLDPSSRAETMGDIFEAAKNGHRGGKSLRQTQEESAKPILSFLATHVWPGVELLPVLDNDSILPSPQPEQTTQVIKEWVHGLAPWDLAGLERACLATKSLCIAARFLVDWSGEHDSQTWLKGEGKARFTIEDAADACSLEVRWQTGMWGEVEDTHDVEKEDLKRQLGSVILLVNGAGT